MKILKIVFCAIFLLSVFVYAGDEVSEEPPAKYTVGIDDILEISILQPERISTIVAVSPDGAITFPYVGNVQVKDMPMEKIQEKIQSMLANYMKYPVISISLRESRSRKFYIYGNVIHPGVYPVEENLTLLRSISIAGGFVQYGPASRVKILRPKKGENVFENIKININDLMAGVTKDIYIYPQDVIEISAGRFSISGKIAKPGIYSIEENTTLLMAISLAGGLIEENTINEVKIIRTQKGKENEIKLDIKDAVKNNSGQNVAIQHGDLIIIAGMQKGYFYVNGDVKNPGIYPYPLEEKITALKAISIAGGFQKNGFITKVKLLRPNEKTGYEVINLNIKEITEGHILDTYIQLGDILEVTNNKFYISGKVINPGMYPIEENTTIMKAVASAGGFVDARFASEGRIIRRQKDKDENEIIKINIKDIVEGKYKDINIESGDVIEIKDMDVGNFYVYGEVLKPGAFPYPPEENITVLKAISIAGGFSKYSSSKQIKLLKLKKENSGYEMRKINARELIEGGGGRDLTVNIGDIVEVLEENKFSISGDILKPGIYYIEENTTILKAITLAGGYARYGSLKRAILRRLKNDGAGYEPVNININAINKENNNQDILIQPGDDIEIISEKFYISGEVLRPGEFLLDENITVLKAISMAGGLTKFGSINNVKVLRLKNNKVEYENIKINMKAAMEGSSGSDTIIQPGDIIEILPEKFFVSGEVLRPGEFFLDENITVLKAISMAGGFTKYGSMKGVKILRLKKDKAEYENIKVNMKAAMDGSSESDIILQPGDNVVVTE
ncbi:SLBB domain-containing protein [Candidatus Desantisbacteria bacterium]|nr:SLBB domain-containing protein [Candidatus Desantisbacteria bacterium]